MSSTVTVCITIKLSIAGQCDLFGTNVQNLVDFHRFLDLGHFTRKDMLFYYEEMVKVLEAGSLLFGNYRLQAIEERGKRIS